MNNMLLILKENCGKLTNLTINLENFFKINNIDEILWWHKNTIFKKFARNILEYENLYKNDFLSTYINIPKKHIKKINIYNTNDLEFQLLGLNVSCINYENINVLVGITKTEISFINSNISKVYVYIPEKNCFKRIVFSNLKDLNFEIFVEENCTKDKKIYLYKDHIRNINYEKNINATLSKKYFNSMICEYNKNNFSRISKDYFKKIIIENLNGFNESFKNYNITNEYEENVMLKNANYYFPKLKHKRGDEITKDFYNFIKIHNWVFLSPYSLKELCKILFKNLPDNNYEKDKIIRIIIDIFVFSITNGNLKLKDFLRVIQSSEFEKDTVILFFKLLEKSFDNEIHQNLKSDINNFVIKEFSKVLRRKNILKYLFSVS